MDRIPGAGELSAEELSSLRLVVTRSFISRTSMPAARRARLVELGLIQNGMGGLMPTPAGKIVARL